MSGATLLVGGLLAFIVLQVIILVVAGSRRDHVSVLSKEFWT